LICPSCGEDNSSDFRFCGMCGTPLEAQRSPVSAGAASQQPVRAAGNRADAGRLAENPMAETRRTEPRHAPVLNNPPLQARQAETPKRSPVISGPSLLGLGQDADTKPTIDTLREKSFSRYDSLLEQEQESRPGRRIVMLLVLLAALVAAGWWTYSNYQGAMNRIPRTAGSGPAPQTPPPAAAAKPESATATSSPPPAMQPSTEPSSPAQPAAQSQSQPQTAPSIPPRTSAAPAQPVAHHNTEADAPRPAVQVNASRTKVPHAEPPAQDIVPAATGGEADYRMAEAYLYGRGVAQNCDEAVKHLKAASAKQSAKARSTFGTMYATGHCVPRDLPTSYGWFALALHVDPSNQILEKDLTAIWNQMTPPERETATKSKQ